MKIAININGQFNSSRMTGIQQYVDSLLTALYAVNTEHELIAFAPGLWSLEAWDHVLQDGLFAWREHPQARIETLGNEFDLKGLPFVRGRPPLRVWANRVDSHVINPIKFSMRPRRDRRASRRYDLMHMPDANQLEFLKYEPAHHIATIYDLTTITCTWAHNARNIQTWGRFFEYVKQRCARVLTISEFSKHDIVEYLGIPADRVDVTTLAPRRATRRIQDPVQISETLRRLDLPDAPFVLYAGTLEPRKNLKRLVEAFAQAVADARLHDRKLVLAGGAWDKHDQELREYAAEIGVGDQVIVTGYVSNEDMNVLMSSCAAFAYVSEYEGFGMPPLEAMTCGAPVVASNTTSLPEVVGEAGIQVDPLDVEAIAGALHRLLTDCGENARRRELSLARAGEFSWERTARLTLQSYEAAVA